MKKDIQEFPFDTLFSSVHQAGVRVNTLLTKESKEAHSRRVAKLIEAEYANREDSFEGDASEEYPYHGIDQVYLDEEIAKAKKAAFALFAEKYDMKNEASWLLPQLAAYIAKLPLTTLENGKIDSVAYMQNFGQDAFHKGIWTMCRHAVRGDFLAKQYTPEARNYSALVPLLLMPHKKFDGIGYERWDLKGLDKLVDPNLWLAMNCKYEVENTTEEILAIREKGLTYQSGKSLGTVRNPVTTHKVYSVTGSLKTIPWLTQVMVFQIWCAHPVNRTDLMILDWNNWDNIPEPLITTELTKPTVKAFISKKEVEVDDLPWDC